MDIATSIETVGRALVAVTAMTMHMSSNFHIVAASILLFAWAVLPLLE